ncbi:MAG: hypothetical protein ACI37N_08190 [Prevotella sp.]
MTDRGSTPNDIAQRLIDDGYSSDLVAAYCELYNELAEDLVSEDNSSNNGSMFHGDTMEAKNAIIEALQGGRKNLGKNTSDDFKEFERERNQQRDDFYEENFGMSYSDYLAFEEQEMPSIWRQMSNFVAEEYDRIVNESYEMRDEQNNVEQINNENNGNNTEGNRQLAGGHEILPTEGSNQQGGTSTSTNPAAETTNGSEGGNQNEEVQGGALSNKEVYNRHTTTKQSAETAEASQDVEQGDTQTSSSMNAPTPSEGKDTTKSPTSQENQQKTDKKVKEPQNEEVQGSAQGVGQIGEESSQWNTLSEEDAKMLIQNMEDSLLPNSSDMHLAENPNGLPDLLPTQESNESISDGKDTIKSQNSQEKQQKTDEKVEEPQNEEVQGGVQGEFQNNEPQPIVEGDFGPIYNQFKGNAKGAVAQLSKIRNGEATAALHHKDIGDIDIV